MKDTDPQISRLLRLKRFERPPEGYFEDFLAEFQKRQRLEAMNVSWWERCRESIETVFERVQVPGYAYATVGLFAVAMGAWILSSDEVGTAGGSALAAETAPVPGLRLDLTSGTQEVLPAPVTIPQQRLVGTLPPHYVLQKAPAAQSDPFTF
jgi:hypothetical protein